MNKVAKALVISVLAGLIFFVNPLFLDASVEEDINVRNEQIKELEKQIEQYQQQINEKSVIGRSLANEIAILNARINQIQAEITSLSLSIEKTGVEMNQTTDQITEAENRLSKYRISLALSLKMLDQAEQDNLIEIILKNESFSSFFDDINSLQVAQETMRVTIGNIKDLRSDLEEKQKTLEEQKKDLEYLKNIQQIEQRSIGQVRSEKNDILKVTKGEEAKFQKLAQESKADIEKIRTQIFYLQQNGISAEEAVKSAQLAAIGAGIRPAFLLGILEIESGLGRNVGTGNWRDDMYECYIRLGTIYYPNRKEYYLQRAETEKKAFFAIIGKLGLDPNSAKVSKEPSYGCGGAMGPAQFIPSTWLGYEVEVARLTGHNPPSPWSVEDAFTASAIKLARAGANKQTRESEIAAAKAYISGNSKCSSSTCNYYANAVLRKADEIAKNL